MSRANILLLIPNIVLLVIYCTGYKGHQNVLVYHHKYSFISPADLKTESFYITSSEIKIDSWFLDKHIERNKLTVKSAPKDTLKHIFFTDSSINLFKSNTDSSVYLLIIGDYNNEDVDNIVGLLEIYSSEKTYFELSYVALGTFFCRRENLSNPDTSICYHIYNMKADTIYLLDSVAFR